MQVQFEQPAQEAVDEQQVFLAMRQPRCRPFGILQPQVDVGDVGLERGEALAGDLLPDEVADQQAEKRVAFQRRELDGGSGVVA